MGLYDRYILPHVVHMACSARPTMKQREKIVPLARGNVLEIGIGAGLNLPHYDADQVKKVWGLDPPPEMRRKAEKIAETVPVDVEFIGLPSEEIPLDDNSVDTVLITYTLCTIPDSEPALRQMARVLKSGGELLFCEHGAAPDADVKRWQDRVNPLWQRIGGGCNLNRPIPDLIEKGGFHVTGLETMYLPGWRPASFNYWGAAKQA